jgi:CheY-like chemotaxis protein
MGGNIWFDTEIGQGTTFYYSFPKNLFAISKKKKKEVTNEFPNWADHIILIAEDVEFNFMYLKEILTTTGAKIIWAKNGREAVECVKQQVPSLVLMDLQMPEMNGYEATRALRKDYPDLPIVVQTAFSMADEEQKCFETGCNDFLAKPIRAKQLIKTIEKYI